MSFTRLVGLIVILAGASTAIVPDTPLYYCNATTAVCVFWPNVDEAVQPHPSLTDIISYISPAGWTIYITDCTTVCTISTCSVPPSTACNLDVAIETTYIDVPNVRILPTSGTIKLVMDGTTWASEAANNESYPCSPFIVTTHNVSISNFKFQTEACVEQLPAWVQITGVPPSLFWLMTTPVIILADVAPLTRLSTLQWDSGSTAVTNRGDAIVRVISYTPGAIIDLNGSTFTAITGRPDLASPISLLTTGTSNAVPALLIAVHSGTITVTTTKYLVMRTDLVTSSVGAWMGSTLAMAGTLAPDCPVCKSEEELHKTNMIYIIVTASLGGVAVIVAIVLIIVHVRDRRKIDQIELAKFGKNE